MQRQKLNGYRVKIAKMEPYLLKAIFFSVPLVPKSTTILIFTWVLIWLMNYKKDDWQTLLRRRTLLLSIFLYLWLLIGLTYTMDLESGLFKIQTQASFLIFPILLGTRKVAPTMRNTYFKYFIWGVTLATLTCLANGFYRYVEHDSVYVMDEFSRKVNIFTYQEFSKILDMDPAYFSLYLGMAIFYIINKFKWEKSNRMLKDFSMVLLFSTALFLAASKAGIYLFAIILLGFAIYWFIKRSREKFILVLGMLVFSWVVGYSVSPMPFKRLAHAFSSVQQNVNQNVVNESTSIRLDLWRLSFEIAKEAPFFGYGTGSVQKTLNEHCIDFRFFSECELLRNKNSHNQYLNFLLSNGLVFLLVFLTMLVIWMYGAVRMKDELSVFFLLILALNFLFESLLQRERGVVFFMLFATMLLVTQKEKHTDELKQEFDGVERN